MEIGCQDAEQEPPLVCGCSESHKNRIVSLPRQLLKSDFIYSSVDIIW
jgi:hypothetical protein